MIIGSNPGSLIVISPSSEAEIVGDPLSNRTPLRRDTSIATGFQWYGRSTLTAGVNDCVTTRTKGNAMNLDERSATNRANTLLGREFVLPFLVRFARFAHVP
jgi:hypothetical protein